MALIQTAATGRLIQPAVWLAVRLTSLIRPNRAADPKNEDILERGIPFFAPVWSGHRSESWLLEMLAVDPDYQGQGCGRALVQWGLDLAEKEGVCASVISADGKEGFYRKCGFDVQEGHGGQGEGNPLKDVAGGLIFWKEAKVRDGQ